MNKSKRKAVASLINLERKRTALTGMARRYNMLGQNLERHMRTMNAASSPNAPPFLRNQGRLARNRAENIIKQMKNLANLHQKTRVKLNFLTEKSIINLAKNMTK